MVKQLPVPVFCINLDRRPERWQLFSEQPGVKGVDIIRFPAVDGKSLSLQDSRISPETRIRILSKTRRSHAEINTLGAIGCTLSHLSVWKRFQTEYRDSEFCIVLEDDAQIPQGLFLAVNRLLPTLPVSLDIWCLGYNLRNDSSVQFQGPWSIPLSFWGTSAYVLRKSAIPRLQEQLLPIECHLDQYLCTQQILGRVRIAIHANIHLANLPSGTDIQLERCSLCNLPDNIEKEGLVITPKLLVYGLFAYAFGMTLFLGLQRNGGYPSSS